VWGERDSYAPARTRLQSHLEYAIANTAPEVNAEDGDQHETRFAQWSDHSQIRLWAKFQLVDNLAHEAAASARVDDSACRIKAGRR
jgi:hypothetical protein